MLRNTVQKTAFQDEAINKNNQLDAFLADLSRIPAKARVNPYFKEMSEEDSGIVRFFATPLNVTSMPEDEAEELIVSKLDSCIEKSKSKGEDIRYNQDIVESLVRLSGGHPHLIQLLGWHLIEREEEEPDGILDIKDLTDALKTICYEDRVYIYDGMINHLKVESTQ